MSSSAEHPVIGFDLSCTLVGPGTGVSRYARRLVEHLPAVMGEGKLEVFRPTGRSLPIPVWRRLVLPRQARAAGVNLLHCPVAHAPFIPGMVVTRTIHDVPEAHPGHRDDSRWRRGRRRTVLAREQPTVLVSGATRDDFLSVVPGFSSATAVIHHGPGIIPGTSGPGASRTLDLPVGCDRYVLVLGTIRPRRNPGVVRRAMEILERDHPQVALVWVGEGRVPFFSSRVVWMGHCNDDTMTGLLQGATCLVCPSSIEGFGLPALEAMAGGIPLVCTDLPVMREIASDAALYYDSQDADGLAHALGEVVQGHDVSGRVDFGRERAASFSWERSAAEHFEFFQGLLGSQA